MTDEQRKKLVNAKEQDEYATQLARQNKGLSCEHCTAYLGHYAECPLINREAAETLAAIRYLEEGL